MFAKCQMRFARNVSAQGAGDASKRTSCDFRKPDGSTAPELDGEATCSRSCGLILNGNKIAWRNGYGMANIAKQIPFSPDQALFQIASVTKIITATAIIQLRDKGLLRLDDDVNKFLKFSVRNPNHANRQITFRSLLKHTSSISDSEAIYSMCAPGDPTVSLEEMVTQYSTPLAYETLF
jgi:CubicO group peptidase (beta-lactamase class C family)